MWETSYQPLYVPYCVHHLILCKIPACCTLQTLPFLPLMQCAYPLALSVSFNFNDPVYIGALFAFLMLSQRVTGPLMQMAQLVNQYDEARIAVAVVCNCCQSTGGRRPFRAWRARAAARRC